jgi:hypothetical protein
MGRAERPRRNRVIKARSNEEGAESRGVVDAVKPGSVRRAAVDAAEHGARV